MNCVFNWYHRYINFNESYKVRKGKDLKVKVLKTMEEKNQFEVDVYAMDNIRESKITKASHIHLTRDKLKRYYIISKV